MAAAVEGRVFRRSSPDTIDADLAALWRELAQGEGAIARAVMSNLIVVRTQVAPNEVDVDAVMEDLPLGEVVARHPSRLIVIEHEPGRHEPGEPFDAGVGIAVFGPATARYGVEQIVVRSACAEESLPSIVRRLARGDVPTSIWWTDDLSEVPLLESLVTMGRQLVYDSRDWRDVQSAVKVLEPFIRHRRVDLADINWRRLGPLRAAIQHASAEAGKPLVAAGARVHIAHQEGEAPLAWMLAGALVALAQGKLELSPQVESVKSGDAALTLTIENRPDRTTHTLTLTATAATVERDRATPLVVTTPIESEAAAVAAELRLLSQDADLHAALAALVRLFAARLS